MAKSGELIDAIAHAAGNLDSVTVGSYYRAIREAGLTTPSARGRGAADMTIRDAANLIIAIGASNTAKGAPDVVKEYRSLRRNHNSAGRQEAPGYSWLPSLAGDAIEKLIELEISGEADEHLRQFSETGFLEMPDDELQFALGPLPDEAIADLKRQVASGQVMQEYTLRFDRTTMEISLELFRHANLIIGRDMFSDVCSFWDPDGTGEYHPFSITCSISRYLLRVVGKLLAGSHAESHEVTS